MINGHDRYIWELCKNMNCRQNCPQKFFFFRKEKNHMENQWSSRIGFILASAGAAIGLGAIWKFPYVAGMNGGAAFLIIFFFYRLNRLAYVDLRISYRTQYRKRSCHSFLTLWLRALFGELSAVLVWPAVFCSFLFIV